MFNEYFGKADIVFEKKVNKNGGEKQIEGSVERKQMKNNNENSQKKNPKKIDKENTQKEKGNKEPRGMHHCPFVCIITIRHVKPSLLGRLLYRSPT